MLRDDQIQAALVAYLKSNTDIVAELGAEGTDEDEIREDTWQGTEFSYPNIRVNLISNVPTNDNCPTSRIVVSFMVFTEDSSSQLSDRIAGIINTTLNYRSFVSNNIAFTARITNLVPAVRRDQRTWMSEARFSMLVSGSG